MRIGELAAQAGVTTTTVRYYETLGLIPAPARTPNGYRHYRPGDAERLTFIRTARHLGLCLEEIRHVLALRDEGEQPCGFVSEALGRHLAVLDRRITELVALRGQLAVIVATEWPDTGDGRFCALIDGHRTPTP